MSQEKISVFVLVDGLGWEISRQVKSLDFLEGCRKPLETVLGYSSSAIPSILTGKYPQEHGMWNLFYSSEDKTDFPLFKMHPYLPGAIRENRYLRKGMLMANKWVTGFDGYYQSYDMPSDRLARLRISESGNIYKPGGIENCENLFDSLVRHGVNYQCFSYKDLPDEKILQQLVTCEKKNRPDFYFVYLCGFDGFGHRHADDEALMLNEAERIARYLHDWYNQLKLDHDEVEFTVFSDHGMVPLERSINIPEKIESLPEPLKSSLLPIYDSTMARFHTGYPGSEGAVREVLAKLPGHFLEQDDLDRYRVDFKGKYGDLIFLADPGVQLAPSHMSAVP